jgi:hypothetical protein
LLLVDLVVDRRIDHQGDLVDGFAPVQFNTFENYVRYVFTR